MLNSNGLLGLVGESTSPDLRGPASFPTAGQDLLPSMVWLVGWVNKGLECGRRRRRRRECLELGIYLE